MIDPKLFTAFAEEIFGEGKKLLPLFFFSDASGKGFSEAFVLLFFNLSDLNIVVLGIMSTFVMSKAYVANTHNFSRVYNTISDFPIWEKNTKREIINLAFI